MKANGHVEFASIDEFEEFLECVTAERLKRRAVFVKTGNWAALYDALRQALVDDGHVRAAAPDASSASFDDVVPVPRWVLDAILAQVMPHFLKSVRQARTGRAARWVTRYRQDLVDWRRYVQVWYRRIGRRDDMEGPLTKEEIRSRRRRFRKLKGAGEMIQTDLPHLLKANKEGDPTAFEAAAKELGERSASSVKSSYERVHATLLRGDGARYYPTRWLKLRGLPKLADADRAR